MADVRSYAVALLAAGTIAIAAGVYLPWFYYPSWHNEPATHSGLFGFYTSPNPDVASKRIYSGPRASVVLTVRFDAMTAVQGSVEVLVNGSAITDGVIQKYGFDSRTFRLQNVETIDLVMRTPPPAGDPMPGSITGEYTVTAPL